MDACGMIGYTIQQLADKFGENPSQAFQQQYGQYDYMYFIENNMPAVFTVVKSDYEIHKLIDDLNAGKFAHPKICVNGRTVLAPIILPVAVCRDSCQAVVELKDVYNMFVDKLSVSQYFNLSNNDNLVVLVKYPGQRAIKYRSALVVRNGVYETSVEQLHPLMKSSFSRLRRFIIEAKNEFMDNYQTIIDLLKQLRFGNMYVNSQTFEVKFPIKSTLRTIKQALVSQQKYGSLSQGLDSMHLLGLAVDIDQTLIANLTCTDGVSSVDRRIVLPLTSFKYNDVENVKGSLLGYLKEYENVYVVTKLMEHMQRGFENVGCYCKQQAAENIHWLWQDGEPQHFQYKPNKPLGQVSGFVLNDAQIDDVIYAYSGYKE